MLPLRYGSKELKKMRDVSTVVRFTGMIDSERDVTVQEGLSEFAEERRTPD